jgi:hypothetical protein
MELKLREVIVQGKHFIHTPVMLRETRSIYDLLIRTRAGRLHSLSLGCDRLRDRQFQKNRLRIQISETKNRGLSQSINYFKDNNGYNWCYDGPPKCPYRPQRHDSIEIMARPEFIKGFSPLNRGINQRNSIEYEDEHPKINRMY